MTERHTYTDAELVELLAGARADERAHVRAELADRLDDELAVLMGLGHHAAALHLTTSLMSELRGEVAHTPAPQAIAAPDPTPAPRRTDDEDDAAMIAGLTTSVLTQRRGYASR